MNKPILVTGLFLLFIGMAPSVFSQSVGMNSTGATPSSNSVLDLNTGNTSRNQGFIAPWVTLGSSLSTFSPPIVGSATAGDVGMIVYNSSATNQPIGYYYWSGSAWVGLSPSGINWLLTGNSGTVVGTNYLGTNDAQALEFKVDAQKAGYIDYTTPYNTTFGWEAGNGLTSTSTVNTAVGLKALYSNTKQSGNAAMGDSALYTQSYGTGFNSGNIAIGNSALFANQPSSTSNGNQNTAIGEWAMRYNTTGYQNVGLGYGALYANTTAYLNTAVGYQSLFNNTVTSQNVAIGMDALYTQSYSSSAFNSYNTAVGVDALYTNNPTSTSNGLMNTALGAATLYSNQTGAYNTACGVNASRDNSTASNNSAFGYEALYNNSTGGNNTAIGYLALNTYSAGSSNTAVGYAADIAANSLSNATTIGNQAVVGSSNMIQLGNSSVVAVESSGNSVLYNPTTTSFSSGGTATGLQIVSGCLTGTPTLAVNITLPTAANLATAIRGNGASVTTGTSLCFTVIDNAATSGLSMSISVNTGITVITSAALTGETNMTVSGSSVGIFRIVFTSATTAVIMRVG